MNTQEALRAYAPEFVALDEEINDLPSREFIGVGTRDIKLLLDAHAQALVKLAEVGNDAEIIQQCAERLQINIKAQEARIQDLEEKLGKAREALRFYGSQGVSLEHGDHARVVLAEIGGE